MDRDDIKKQMYDITAILIDRLQMMRLWGYGFPDIPLYVYILRQYLQYISYLPSYSIDKSLLHYYNILMKLVLSYQFL